VKSRRIPGIALVCVLGISAWIAVCVAGGGTVCYVKSVFGLPCPGCGMTRAWVSLFHADPVSAFRFHPLFPVPAVIGVFFLIRSRAPALWKSGYVWVPAVVLFVSVYAVRMYLYFPHNAPFDFNHNALLVRLGGLIVSFVR